MVEHLNKGNKMKTITVRVNKTIAYDVSVPVQDEHDYPEIREYVNSINWDKEIKVSPQNFKHIAEYTEWVDWDLDQPKLVWGEERTNEILDHWLGDAANHQARLNLHDECRSSARVMQDVIDWWESSQ